MNTLLTIEGHVYKVTSKFTHPGEGIRDQYICNYKNKEVSEEFDYYHMTNEPWEILEKVRDKGEFGGIVYMGTQQQYESTQTLNEKEVAQKASAQTEEKEA